MFILKTKIQDPKNIPEVGKTYQDQLIWINGKAHYIPIHVIRQTTKEEYIKDCIDKNYDVGLILKDDLFFEVHTD